MGFAFFIGDDCIAINGGSSFINISDITCGPGHGIRSVDVNFLYFHIKSFDQ